MNFTRRLSRLCHLNIPKSNAALFNQPFYTNKASSQDLSTTPSQSTECHKLTHRGILKVDGKDASAFLQGLITNDMACLDEKCDIQSIFTMLLNVQGRILYDMIIYKCYSGADENKKSYLIECDKEVTSELISTIKRYKIRKKVDIVDVSNEMNVWAVGPNNIAELETLPTLEIDERCKSNVILSCVDPRVKSFGWKLLLPDGINGDKVVTNSENVNDPSAYHMRRYHFGLGEGITDMPPGNSTPLESNGVFMNGVSFNKGCYIGQELTARSHHTGVIRKRLMPVQLHGTQNFNPGYTVENLRGKNCGKMRGSIGQNGLALLRIGEVMGCELSVKDNSNNSVGTLSTWIPQWWPRDTDEVIKKALLQLNEKDHNE